MRVESMRAQSMGPGGDLVVTAPCAGTVLRIMVSAAGAVVQAGDALGEVACAGERLQIELALGQQAVARVREGQGAKLLYDAFPYQRFGVKFGRVRWVGPATALPSANANGSAAGHARIPSIDRRRRQHDRRQRRRPAAPRRHARQRARRHRATVVDQFCFRAAARASRKFLERAAGRTTTKARTAFVIRLSP